jgi:hypothetical protein
MDSNSDKATPGMALALIGEMVVTATTPNAADIFDRNALLSLLLLEDIMFKAVVDDDGVDGKANADADAMHIAAADDI